MTLRGKVDRIEKAIISSGELSPSELWNPFEGWTKKEIDRYRRIGDKPKGKGLAPCHFSAKMDQKINENFSSFKGLTKDQIYKILVHFALTGIWLERANLDEN